MNPHDEFAEKIRTVRKLAGLSAKGLAGVLCEDSAREGQGARERFWDTRGREPDRRDTKDLRFAQKQFVGAWNVLVDFGATDDMRDACEKAWREAFFSDGTPG